MLPTITIKRFVAVVLACLVIVSMISPAYAESISDSEANTTEETAEEDEKAELSSALEEENSNGLEEESEAALYNAVVQSLENGTLQMHHGDAAEYVESMLTSNEDEDDGSSDTIALLFEMTVGGCLNFYTDGELTGTITYADMREDEDIGTSYAANAELDFEAVCDENCGVQELQLIDSDGFIVETFTDDDADGVIAVFTTTPSNGTMTIRALFLDEDQEASEGEFFAAGETVAVRVVAEDGYELDEAVVTAEDGETVEYEQVDDVLYFVMPESNVTIDASSVVSEEAETGDTDAVVEAAEDTESIETSEDEDVIRVEDKTEDVSESDNMVADAVEVLGENETTGEEAEEIFENEILVIAESAAASTGTYTITRGDTVVIPGTYSDSGVTGLTISAAYEACTTITSGGSYLIANYQSGTAVFLTSTAATSGSTNGLALASDTNATMVTQDDVTYIISTAAANGTSWAITANGEGYTVGAGGQYLTINNYNITMNRNSQALAIPLVSGESYYTIGNNGYYIDRYSTSVAAGWYSGSSNANECWYLLQENGTAVTSSTPGTYEVTTSEGTYTIVVEDFETVQGTTPSGTTVNLFDYWYTSQDTADNTSTTSAELESGINAGHALKFSKGIYPNGAYNQWTGSEDVYEDIVQTLLENGYPVLNYLSYSSTAFSVTNSTESLAYLFDPTTILDGKASYSDVQNLFQVDDDGYYYYNSKENFAEYNEETNSFILYAGWAVNQGSTMEGQFFPFNSYEDVDQDTYATDAVLNHYFGLSVTTYFIQEYGGYTSAEQTTETTFEFSGDDDIWIYIDDVLIADLGGIHDAASVTINFATGVITVNGEEIGTLKEAYEAAGVDYYTLWDGDTFADGTYHTLSMYYLERGNSSSNLQIKFNQIQVEEEDVPGPPFEFSYVKIDGDFDGDVTDATTISDVSFALYEAVWDGTSSSYIKGDYITTAISDVDGVVCFDVGTGIYWVEEIGTASGYETAVWHWIAYVGKYGDVTMTPVYDNTTVCAGVYSNTVGGETTYYWPNYQHKTGSIAIIKYGIDNTLLSGVKFALLDENGDKVATGTTDDDGSLVFSDLEPGTYTIVETSTVSGCTLLSETITVEIPLALTSSEIASYGSSINTSKGKYNPETDTWYFYDLTYEIYNSADLVLPITGGNGNVLYLCAIVFFVMMGLSVIVSVLMRKKQGVPVRELACADHAAGDNDGDYGAERRRCVRLGQNPSQENTWPVRFRRRE